MTIQATSMLAFDRAFYAAWAASWLAYVRAGHSDAGESVEIAESRASGAMEDAKAALAAACPGLEVFV